MKKFWNKIHNKSEEEKYRWIVNDTLRVLCFGTLLANGEVVFDDDLRNADRWFDDHLGDCSYCPFKNKCLAVRAIEEVLE